MILHVTYHSFPSLRLELQFVRSFFEHGIITLRISRIMRSSMACRTYSDYPVGVIWSSIRESSCVMGL